MGKENQGWRIDELRRERTKETEQVRRQRKELSIQVMREGKIDWGVWKRTGRGMKRRKKIGIPETQRLPR